LGDGTLTDASAPSGATPDPLAILRSRSFIAVLVLAAVIGVVVSFVSWAFLELVHYTQQGLFTDLPEDFGWDSIPWWWYLVVLGVAGLPVAFAIDRLPGAGGHVPAHGLQMGGNQPSVVAGVVLAGWASIGFGVVLGPEAPLITVGAGLATYTVALVRRDAPPQLVTVLAAAGSLAAISVIFGSPIVSAVIVVEAAGLGGSTLPLIVVPGLIAGGVGSLVFIGMAHWSGLSTAAYSLVPLELPRFSGVTWEEIGWALALGVAGALITFCVMGLGVRVSRVVPSKPFVLIPLSGLVVAAAAILFERSTDHGTDQVLFSGQDALPGLISGAGTWSVEALLMLIVCKGLAWGVSLGGFRGGPTFPAIYLGAAGGIAASHLPGLSLTAGIAVGIGVMIVAVLKLPLSAIVIATALTASAGLAVGPLIILAVVAAYLTTLALQGRLGPPGSVFGRAVTETTPPGALDGRRGP
jgi:H+/Cl- antiporter ClcA